MNIILKAFSMWRFFRLSIKHNSCPGNQTHFRIIGTTCANTESEELEDICKCESKDFKSISNKENFAAVASKSFHKSLQSQKNAAIALHEKSKNAYEPFGITSANAECDDLENIYTHESKDFEPVSKNENFASVASKSFQKSLQSQKNAAITLVKTEKNACKSFGITDKCTGILKENSQNYRENLKKVNKDVKHYSDLDINFEKNLKFVVNDNIEFGSLAEKTKESQFLPDEPDEKQVLEPRFSAQTYGRIMLEHCKERRIKEALNILEVEMKNKDVVPDKYCYNILINACGKMGYAKKAFELFHQMKLRGIKVEKFAYTGLFNACANSPFKSEGLRLANSLRKQLKDNAVLLHPISYHAMIKAFGHCGDIKTAFEIADEMVYVGHPITVETLNFLLHACIAETETGFRHALMVWRKFRTLRITPDVYSYNLLLRCANECGAGDPQFLSELFDDLKENKLKGKLKKLRDKRYEKGKSHFLSANTTQVLTEPDHHVPEEKKSENASILKKEGANQTAKKEFWQVGDKNEIVKVNLEPNMEMELVSPEKLIPKDKEELVLPNVLSHFVKTGNILAISSLEKNEDRLWLLGGVTGVLESMREDRTKPNIVTFNNILESLPNSLEVEDALLKSMEKVKVKPNIIFCNKLIRKRCLRGSLKEAKEVLTLMQKYNVPIDLVSYGCFSIGCRRPSEIKQLLRDMSKNSIIPNEEIMNCLVLNSIRSREYALSIELLGRMKRLEVPITEYLLILLENTRTNIRKRSIEIESESSETILTPREKRIREEMKLFLMEYKHFLSTSKVELQEHPWAQFGYNEQSKEIAKQNNI